MIVFAQLTVLLVLCSLHVHSATISWNSDQITLTSTQTPNFTRYDLEVDVSSNGMIYDDELGNFRLVVESANNKGNLYMGQTDCLFVSSTVPTLQKSLNNLRLNLVHISGNETSQAWYRTQDLFLVDVKRFFYRDDYTAARPFKTSFQVGFTHRSNVMRTVTVAVSQQGCLPMRTVGEWGDYHRWSGQTVPTEDDDVTFTAGAGVIVMDSDVKIHSLSMNGGHIVNYKTYCPRGWSVEPEGYHGYVHFTIWCSVCCLLI